jgi:hypothetical protein
MASGTSKNKERVPNPTGNIVSTTTVATVTYKKDDKDSYPKVQISDLFYGDRKKFKVYYT